jgi:dTDP-4-dehydrorhamnose reductase
MWGFLKADCPTQWLYGRHGNNFVASILGQARKKDELRIVDDQVGSPTYSVDLSKILGTLIQKKAEGVFHVTNSGTCSWYEFGRTILQLSGLDRIRVIPSLPRAKEPRDSATTRFLAVRR